MTEKFKELVDGESLEVNSIIETMCHSKKNDARRALMFINSIIDYYTAYPKEGKTQFPIICIPNAPKWAKSVVLEFLIIKTSLYYNSKKRTEFTKRLNIDPITKNEEEFKYYKEYEMPFRKYIRQASQLWINKYWGEDDHKNLIFCSDADFNISKNDKNKFINEFFGPVDEVCFDSNLTICHGIEAKGIKKQIDEYDKDINIDNIFVLYTNNKQCNSLNDTSIKRISQDIRNCFVFDFIYEPFRLYRAQDKRITFSRKFPMLIGKDALTNKDFIAITDEESRYLFSLNYDCNQLHVQDDQLFFNGWISDIFDNSEHPIRERMHFSLCLDDMQKMEYLKELNKNFPNESQDFYLMSIEHQLTIAKNEIIPKIKSFSSKAYKVAIILPYDATHCEKQMLKRIFNEYQTIHFYTLRDLKPTKGKNKIKELCIINFVYRPHYANLPYHKYPNSFDPYFLNANQCMMNIINGVAFENMYLWDLYEYNKMICHLLNSAFRLSYIGKPKEPERPVVDRASEEIDFGDERTQARSVKSYKVFFKDGTSNKIPETEFVVAEIKSERSICRIGKLAEIEDSGISLQKLKELEYVLEEFMQKKSKEAEHAEREIRNYYFKIDAITEEEKDSKEFLWKILLSHKVNEFGPKKVYSEIMSELKEKDRIQENTFKHWYNKDSSMIFPLQKVCQKRLIEYLGLDKSPYLSIIRSQKRARVNDTRQLNGMKDKFMMSMLFQDIDEDKYEEFLNSDINDILQIDNAADLNALVEMIEENIKLKPVESIK